MVRFFVLSVLILSLLVGPAQAATDPAVVKHLQEISVKIVTPTGSGSGVVVTREIEGKKVTVIITAAHVVDGLKKVRNVIDGATGTERKIVEFSDAQVVTELTEDGRRVGTLNMDASVIKYSDSETGEDIAILRVRKNDYLAVNTEFYLDNDMIVPIGTDLCHVGSMLGEANGYTTGVLSQIGRVLLNREFDQTSVAALGGSSGGGVFLTDGRYMGMLVRGSGGTFNLVVPVRRLHKWAKANSLEWVLNKDLPVPPLAELKKMVIEDNGVTFAKSSNETSPTPDFDQDYHFLFNPRKSLSPELLD